MSTSTSSLNAAMTPKAVRQSAMSEIRAPRGTPKTEAAATPLKMTEVARLC